MPWFLFARVLEILEFEVRRYLEVGIFSVVFLKHGCRESLIQNSSRRTILRWLLIAQKNWRLRLDRRGDRSFQLSHGPSVPALLCCWSHELILFSTYT